MQDLYRLVYTSFRKPICTDAEIQKILDSCRRNNPDRDVTGILLYSKSRFIQYLEGSREDTETLFELIKKDDRHTAINKRSFKPIQQRIFPGWAMGCKNVEGERLTLDTHISSSDKQKFEAIIGAITGTDFDFDNEGIRTLQLFFKS